MSGQKIDSPHDLMARNYFSNPSAMANFLREFLPADMYAALDTSSLDPGKESYISEDLKESIADLVFRCKLKNGRQGSVYVLFEHKNQPAPTCALQILRYMSMIWEQEVQTGRYRENGRRLSFIIPVVFYHGKRKWNGRQMRDLFPKNPAFSACIPDFRMIVSNLRETPAEKLQNNLVPNGMLLLLKALLLDNPLPEISRILCELHFADKPEARHDIELFLTYLPRTKQKFSRKELVETIEEITMQQGMTVTSSTFGEYWFPEYFHKVVGEGEARGEARGRAEGRVEGRAEGRVEGRTEGQSMGLKFAVRSFLNSRFSPVQPAMWELLEKINDLSALSDLVTNMHRAETIDEARQLLEQASAQSASVN